MQPNRFEETVYYFSFLKYTLISCTLSSTLFITTAQEELPLSPNQEKHFKCTKTEDIWKIWYFLSQQHNQPKLDTSWKMQCLNCIHKGGNQNTHIYNIASAEKIFKNIFKNLTVHVINIDNLMTFKISKAKYLKEVGKKMRHNSKNPTIVSSFSHYSVSVFNIQCYVYTWTCDSLHHIFQSVNNTAFPSGLDRPWFLLKVDLYVSLSL